MANLMRPTLPIINVLMLVAILMALIAIGVMCGFVFYCFIHPCIKRRRLNQGEQTARFNCNDDRAILLSPNYQATESSGVYP